ncbi:MAG: ABC transporter permease [Clostridia bacterium]|nr:ABC transporter permease [Clostridia bacterium]
MISCAASLFAIAAGLLFGLLLLYLFNSPYAYSGFIKILTSGLANTERFGKVLYQSAPLLMTGLAVSFAFKTGLFNIGATGQYTIGAFFSLTAAISFQLPWWAALIMAMVGGAVWGAIPGLFKAYFNVNEVITSIMFNWIGLYAVNLIITNMPVMLDNAWRTGGTRDRTAMLKHANLDALIPKLGLDELLGTNYVNIGIFVAMLLALITWVILQKTTFGYELKACGYNRSAGEYAGVNSRRNIVLSMMISGALAGAGGGIYYLSGTAQYTLVKNLLPMGFNGIPVALLANSHPLGTIFSSLFISVVQVGGEALQPEFSREIIDIIIAAIIYLSAFSLLMRTMLAKLFTGRKKQAADDFSAEPAQEENA